MTDLSLLLLGLAGLCALFAAGAWLCDNADARDARNRNHARRMR